MQGAYSRKIRPLLWLGACFFQVNCTNSLSTLLINPNLAVPDGRIFTTGVSYQNATALVTLSWNQATSLHLPINYKVCISSANPGPNSFSTLTDVLQGNCTPFTNAPSNPPSLLTLQVPAISLPTLGTGSGTFYGAAYFFNVLATDASGAMAVYTAKGEYLDTSMVDYYPLEGNFYDAVTQSAVSGGGNNPLSLKGSHGTSGFVPNGAGQANFMFNFGSGNGSVCLQSSNALSPSLGTSLTNLTLLVTGTYAGEADFVDSPFAAFNLSNTSISGGEFGVRLMSQKYTVWNGANFATSQTFTGLSYAQSFPSVYTQIWGVTSPSSGGSAFVVNSGMYAVSTSAAVPVVTSSTYLFLGCDSTSSSSITPADYSGAVLARARFFLRAFTQTDMTNLYNVESLVW